MQLAVRQEDSDILLKERNELNEGILDRYRTAGQIAQTGLKYVISLIHDSYHLGKVEKAYTCQELCVLGDSMLNKLLSRVYNNDVREKGISQPVSIELNEIVGNFSPEIDDKALYTFTPGDILSVTLGVHIDGYTANVSHTLVIYPPGKLVGDEIKPEGPLLGTKADAICAAHIAAEVVTSLLGTAFSPEKLPEGLRTAGNKVGGEQIRRVVDAIAASFNCVVVPGSKVRRIRRFLAGQAEGIVAEKEFKGVVWYESDQEKTLLAKSNENSGANSLVGYEKQQLEKRTAHVTDSSAIPTDDFVVLPGEAYTIDIKMGSLGDFAEPGLITLEDVDEFTGTSNKDTFKCRPTVFVRDYAVNYQLKLKGARSLLGLVDKKFTVYPFKLSHASGNFPVSSASPDELSKVQKDVAANRLGLAELVNRHLMNGKHTQIARFIPLEVILNASNPTGRFGIDSSKPTLPGHEVPLPQLGISAVRLKSLLKHGRGVPCARELSTVVLNSYNNSAVVQRLTGGKTAAPSWVHSDYSVSGPLKDAITGLLQLASDKRFGVHIKECSPMKNASLDAAPAQKAETMLLD
ncbi:Piso0_001631 [Millerozyma farinosa CBS 7064]|uniref:Probable metalloprotease ARX1 n=1 Tax=Pichia sorbitophila (strain ATCC MYA-4447 / BCRC 22081 / CBS 7064 / NBRC 10061 / NRRL Y-12695) TaxID=559304 RepID=G8YNN9_PICSO|nr:Piso0_001631 [Millerozyma farinosa CBS 7064]